MNNIERIMQENLSLTSRVAQLEIELGIEKGKVGRLSGHLETVIGQLETIRQATLPVLDTVMKSYEDLDKDAREQVEDELFQAGIIENPDMGGGLFG